MPDIYHIVKINSTSSHIFKAISTIEGLQRWWTPQVSGGTAVNETIQFGFGPDYSKVMQIKRMEPDNLLVWKCLEGVEEWIDTEIEFEIEQVEQQCKVHFSHKNWRAYSGMYGQCNFDWAMFLRSLKQYCEMGKGNPYPDQSK